MHANINSRPMSWKLWFLFDFVVYPGVIWHLVLCMNYDKIFSSQYFK